MAIGKLLGKLLRHTSHYDAVLPYNLNWSLRDWSEFQSLLGREPLRVIDIGARGGAPEELASLRRYIRYVGFDADEDECRRLNAAPPLGYASYEVIPAFIAGAPGPRPFHLYRERGSSSCYLPEPRYRALWGGEGFDVEQTIQVNGLTLDDALSGRDDLLPADMLKLDTQGSELEILRGAPGVLAGAALVEIEVEFVPMYQDQPLFQDVLSFMCERGFELLYLNRVMASRRFVFDGASRGQPIFADALFGRSETELERFSAERIAKYALLLVQYGHTDAAFTITQRYPGAAALIPAIERIFHRHRASKPWSLARRAALMQFDKLLALALHLRRYNQRGSDSDRSWPVR